MSYFNNLTFFLCLFFHGQLIGQQTIRAIRPSDTDVNIATFDADSHYVYLDANAAPRGILLVHLPGSFGEPKRATLFGGHAASLGFHSIGLMYPNIPTVGSICSRSINPDCFEEVRREIVEGVDYGSGITILQNESILSRLKMLLRFLSINYPQEGWGQYLDGNGDIIFPKIIFSGHSQGGGHAALIAKYYPIMRCICFSSPKDWSIRANSPPSWLSPNNWVTGTGSIYCFNHELDEHQQQLEIWDSLGMNAHGSPINVDNTVSPFQNTRQLTTSYGVPLGDEHASTVQDNKTPKIANVPVFLNVWTYMLTHELLSATDELFRDVVKPLVLWPNPTDEVVNFSLPDDSYQVRLIDQLGNVHLDMVSETGKVSIDIAHLPASMYYVVATSRSSCFMAKLFVVGVKRD